MNNNFNLNEIEKLETELNILSEIKLKMDDLLYCKIKDSTKAYSEIEILIDEIEKKEKEKNSKLLIAKNTLKAKTSEIKIESDTLKIYAKH